MKALNTINIANRSPTAHHKQGNPHSKTIGIRPKQTKVSQSLFIFGNMKLRQFESSSLKQNPYLRANKIAVTRHHRLNTSKVIRMSDTTLGDSGNRGNDRMHEFYKSERTTEINVQDQNGFGKYIDLIK